LNHTEDCKQEREKLPAMVYANGISLPRSHTYKYGSIALFVGEDVGGRRRSVEKSKNRTFPPRLEIPQVQQDFHFFHRPCRDEQYFDFPV
jgi:hypothetical protein